MISSGLAPDDFGRIASAVKEYVDLYGDRPAAFLFDFVSVVLLAPGEHRSTRSGP